MAKMTTTNQVVWDQGNNDYLQKRAAVADIMSRYPGLFQNDDDGELTPRFRDLSSIVKWRADMKLQGLDPNKRDVVEKPFKVWGCSPGIAIPTRLGIFTCQKNADEFKQKMIGLGWDRVAVFENEIEIKS